MVKRKTKKEVVKEYYPNAECIVNTGVFTHNSKFLVKDGSRVIGTGNTKEEAWKNAYNVYIKD